MAKVVFVVLIVVLLAALGFLYSSYKKSSLSPEETLAREGGVRLLLEVEQDAIRNRQRGGVVDRAVEIITERVNQMGVRKALVQREGDRRIVVLLPGMDDAERAKNLVGRKALLEFRLVSGHEDVTRVLENLDIALMGVQTEKEVMERGAPYGNSEEQDAESGASASFTDPSSGDVAPAPAKTRGDSILDEMIPPSPDFEKRIRPEEVYDAERPFTSYLLSAYSGGAMVRAKNIDRINLLLSTSEAKEVIPSRLEFLWSIRSRPMQGGGKGCVLYLVEKKTDLTGRAITFAGTRSDPYDPSRRDVAFTLNPEGALMLQKITGFNVGRQLAIVLDGQVCSAPLIETKIPGGEARITGLESDEEANDLAIVLRSGSLPAGITILEEQLVTPAR